MFSALKELNLFTEVFCLGNLLPVSFLSLVPPISPEMFQKIISTSLRLLDVIVFRSSSLEQ